MEQLLVKPMSAAEAIGVGRSKMYEMLATGEIPSIRLGPRSIRIPAHALREWLANKENGDSKAEAPSCPGG